MLGPATARDLESDSRKSRSVGAREMVKQCLNKAKSEETPVEARSDTDVCLCLCLCLFLF